MDNKNLLRLPRNYEDYDYDQWLEFFRKIPVKKLAANQSWLMETIAGDGYAAAARWIEISREPSKMDKLHKSQLKAKTDKDVMELAIGDDDEAFYEALIKENVQQLNSGNVSPQEVARLSQNINIFRKELREIRSRKPKQGTKLSRVLDEVAKINKKPRKVPKKTSTSKKRPHKTASEGSVKKKTISKSSGEKNA